MRSSSGVGNVVRRASGWIFLFCVLGAGLAHANERHFTSTYESGVLPAGAKELEVWSTVGVGRDSRYLGFDHRLEFEVGLTDRLQTSFYLNFHSAGALVAQDAYTTSFDWKGVSNEWKLKLLDPVADPVGLALYAELGLGPSEAEAEAKLILDKRLGNVLLAANLVFEHEWEFGVKTVREWKAEVVVAGSYFITPHLGVGLEVRNTNVIPVGEPLEFSALFIGPVVSYVGDKWWVACTFLPQLPAFKAPEGAVTNLVLTDHERYAARLLFSFQF